MEYSINKLAKLAGISTRTLRYYDEIGLLSPKRVNSNGYRVYGQREVDLLQQILFFRELDMPLAEIKKIVTAKNYAERAVLQQHLNSLRIKQKHLELLINNVEKTISASKGEMIMSDKEKFEGFKRDLIAKNEEKYGEEVREKYGDTVIDDSNAKMMGLTEEKYEEVQELSEKLNELLKKAHTEGNPAGELAQEVCSLHKEWLFYFWPSYSKEAHLGLAQMYVDDPRFKKYYDDIAPGCAEFLHDALLVFCK